MNLLEYLQEGMKAEFEYRNVRPKGSSDWLVDIYTVDGEMLAAGYHLQSKLAYGMEQSRLQSELNLCHLYKQAHEIRRGADV